MTPIPRAALGLGLAGLIPFVWGAASQLFPGLAGLILLAARCHDLTLNVAPGYL